MMSIKQTMVSLAFLCLLISNFSTVGRSQFSPGPADSKETFTLSGTVGLAGVVMTGLPSQVVTDPTGAYTAAAPYAWSGRVVPAKEGYLFEPPSREYRMVTADLRTQDFVARLQVFTISDTILAGKEPIMGVKVTAEPGGQSVITDSHGRYVIQVPYGWTGRLIFSKQDIVFDPDSKPFTNVTSDIAPEQPAPSGRRPASRFSRTPGYPPAVVPGPAGNVFVIPTVQVAPQKLAETAEDLRVMLQILREKVAEPRMVRGAFVDFGSFFDDRSRACEALYLQGSAAVFVLEMDAPFSFAPPQPSESEAPKETVDPVWQRARQKLYSPPDRAVPGSGGLPGDTGQIDFQQFKEDLLKTLRHAANLRNVEPSESVILTIVAHGESGAWPAPASAGGSYGAGGGAWFEGSSYSTSSSSFGPAGGSTYADSRTRSNGSTTGRSAPGRAGPGSVPATPATVLTIQAKKAEIDTFAKGDLSFEQFQQRVKTFTY
jgi:hypothetical protein